MERDYSEHILVTTAIPQTRGESKSLFLLGHWAWPYKDSGLSDKDVFVMEHHWENRAKLSRDHQYLKSLYERVLNALVDDLNAYHNLNFPLFYWRIILGPWLLTYVSVIWDRWESIRISHEKYKSCHTIQLKIPEFSLVPKDYSEAFSYFQNHYWNHQVYGEMLEQFYANDIFIKYLECDFDLVKESFVKKNINTRKTIKAKLVSIYDHMIASIIKKYKVVFVSGVFDPRQLARLAMSIGQVPRMHYEFETKIESTVKPCDRVSRKLIIDARDNFEEYLSNNIYRHLPIDYFEGFLKIREFAENKLPKGKVIFTANAHFHNELFKVWAAESKLNGSRLVTSEHGGSFRSSMSMFDHEESISDIKAVWHIPYKSNHVQLPPNKIIGKARATDGGDRLTVIGLELPLYVYRCQSGPNSSLILNDFEQKIQFYNELPRHIQELTYVRPYPPRGWDLHMRYADVFGEDKIIKGGALQEVFDQSKIVLCTYPQTTFFEALYSGVPTVLLYKEKYWELFPEFDGLLNHLKEVSVIFHDPFLAVQHIENVWSDPDAWWNGEQIIEARKHFDAVCGKISSDAMMRWTNFFKFNI